MTGLFRVHWFDPKRRALNMKSVDVLASNAEEAIKRAEKYKGVKHYRVEYVECFGFSDE